MTRTLRAYYEKPTHSKLLKIMQRLRSLQAIEKVKTVRFQWPQKCFLYFTKTSGNCLGECLTTLLPADRNGFQKSYFIFERVKQHEREFN
jgi:hypothetical protein